MECVTISGILEDDCKQKKDRNGNLCWDFTVICEGIDIYGKTSHTYYTCHCWKTEFSNLKKGELVFINGTQKISFIKGKPRIDVYVRDVQNGTKK